MKNASSHLPNSDRPALYRYKERHATISKEVTMNFSARTLCSTVLLAASASALAAPTLTPQQCNDYPFVKTQGPLTHRQVIQELKELEAFGYQPTLGNDPYYPDDINAAQALLWKEYARDCTPHPVATPPQS
jgi:hypothetical protein